MALKTIHVGSVEIGDGQPCRVIAEGCDNHGGSTSRAKEMIHAAKEAGADIIKFQLHLPDEEMVREETIRTSRSMFAKWGSLYDFVKSLAIPPEAHAELMEECRRVGIQYLCTPFSLKAAEILRQLGAEAFKIGSGETEDLPFIEEAAAMGKPMIVSTGMSELDEIDLMVHAVKERGTPLALAHCISIYSPTETKQLQLGLLRLLRERYGVPVGLSDHTTPEGVKDSRGRQVSQESQMFAAVAAGACFVEKHFTLDRSLPDADSKFSLDPTSLRELVGTLRAAEESLGTERRVFEEERPVHLWAKRSVVAARDIPKGATVTRDMITSKRPGTGIRSKNYRWIVLGRTSARDIAAGEMIMPTDLA